VLRVGTSVDVPSTHVCLRFNRDKKLPSYVQCLMAEGR